MSLVDKNPKGLTIEIPLPAPKLEAVLDELKRVDVFRHLMLKNWNVGCGQALVLKRFLTSKRLKSFVWHSGMELYPRDSDSLRAFELLVEGLAKNGLQELGFMWSGLGDVHMEILFGYLSGVVDLEKLDISHNRIQQEGASYIADYIGSNPGLTSLSLESNPLGDVGVCAMARALSRNSKLKELQLQDCGMSYLGLAGLLDAASGLHTLEIQWNRLGDEGARVLSRFLSTDSRIVKLAVGDVSLNDAQLQILSGSIKKNKYLRELCLFVGASYEAVSSFLDDLEAENTDLQYLHISCCVMGTGLRRKILNIVNRNRELTYQKAFDIVVG